MNLYELDQAIFDCVSEDGEIIDFQKFEKLQLSKKTKIENICLWIKNLKAEIEVLKAEKEAFASRQKTAENKLESLKDYISEYLEYEKFETPKVKVSFRKSESVEIGDNAQIPEEYLKYKTPDIDKAGLKKALKEGKQFVGVSLVEKKNIQIK